MITNETRIIDLTVAELRELLQEIRPVNRIVPNPIISKKKVGINELCSLFGFAKSTVYYWASIRFIPHINVKRRLKFDVDEINTWVEKFKVKTKADYLK